MEVSENVPPVPATEIDFDPFGDSLTVPAPAFIVPTIDTSLAKISTPPLLLLAKIDAPLRAKLPVPLVSICTLPALPLPCAVELALIVMAPFELADVSRNSVAPDVVLLSVMDPLAINSKLPATEVIDPVVVIFADAPVVVIWKLPPTEDVPIARVPVLLMNAPPALPVLAVSAVTLVRRLTPEVPKSPVPDIRLSVPEVIVTAPDLLIEPLPLAVRLTVPAPPVETLALIAMPELLPFVDRLTVEVPDITRLELTPTPTVNVPPELTVIAPVVPEIPPRDVVLEAPRVLIVSVLAPTVIVWLAEVKAPPLLNCRLNTPLGPAPDTLTAPPTVKPPACDVVPTINVPAVMAAMSDAATENVPPAAAYEMDFAPFGISEMVPLPALTVPENVTSLAVMVIGALVVDMALLTPFVTLPVPSVVIVIPVVPVALALRATVPLLPEDVVNNSALPDNALEAVRLPFVVRVSVPVLEVIAPVVVRLAEAPVVVKENVLPTVEAPILTAPAFVTKAVPELVVFTVRLVVALVCIAVVVVPISPVPDDKAMVVPLTVESPTRMMSPVPLALIVLAVDPPIFVPIVMSALLPVEMVVAPPVKLIVPPPVNTTACPEVGDTA